MAKISVIIPIYNVEKYLAKCLNSVITQTLKDIEIICVNDGSKDSSGKIAAEYAAKDPRIICITQENKGLSGARNTGLSKASGRFVIFLDSDDFLLSSESLENLYAKASRYNLDELFFGALPVFESDEVRAKNQSYETYYNRKGTYPDIRRGKDLFADFMKNGDYRANACHQLYRRAFLLEAGLSFKEGIVHEDELFTPKCMMLAKKAFFDPEKYYGRFVRDESIMTSGASAKSVLGYFTAALELEKFAAAHGIFENSELNYETSEISDKNYEKSEQHSDFSEVSEYFFRRIGMLLDHAARIFDAENDPEGVKTYVKSRLSADEYADFLVKIDLALKVRKLKSKPKNSENPKLRNKNSETSEKAKSELRKIKNSNSYKAGKLIMFIPSRLKRAAKKLYRALRKVSLSKSPKISVIIPVYNSENYLRECLDSLLAQTLKDIEIICVNDGSTDSSPQILADYAEKDPRFKIISQENSFAGAARNKGLSLAKGAYLAFLDSDDFFALDFLKKMYARAEKDLLDVVICGGRKFDDDTKTYIEAPHYFKKEMTGGRKVFSVNDIPDKIMSFTNPAPWNKIFRRSFILKEGIRFQLQKSSNDLFFVYTALCAAKKIGFVDSKLVNYRLRTAGSLQSSLSREPAYTFKAYEALYNELNRRALFKKTERSFINALLSSAHYLHKTAKSDKERGEIKRLLSCGAFSSLNICDRPKNYYFKESHIKFAILAQKAVEAPKNINPSASAESTTLASPERGGAGLAGGGVPAVWLIGTPEYNNLGDHMISEASLLFLKEKYPESPLYEITMTDYWDKLPILKDMIKESDILYFQGGGNLGNLWPLSENIRKDACLKWKENKKIILPQSICFEGEDAARALLETKAAYSKGNLLLALRDTASFEFAKKNLDCEICLVPDMVLYPGAKMLAETFISEYAASASELAFPEGRGAREAGGGVSRALLLLRRDKESVLSAPMRLSLESALLDRFEKVEVLDTVTVKLTKETRRQGLGEMFAEIKNADLVVTDRLHGMLFCAILGVPCIVLDNSYHKIGGGFEWIRLLRFIRFTENVEETLSLIFSTPLPTPAENILSADTLFASGEKFSESDFTLESLREKYAPLEI